MALQEDPIVAICKFNETAKQADVKLQNGRVIR